MKETVLNALLQLFAIIANVSDDGVSFKARSIVKTFLRQHLKTNLINKYLVVFDQYLEIHHPHLFGGGITQSKQTLSDSAKLQRIAAGINRSLFQNPAYVPVIGEMMTSRWAYEAIAVHQFKNNRFAREFYAIDQIRNNASYGIEHASMLQLRLNDAAFKKAKGMENLDSGPSKMRQTGKRKPYQTD